MATKACTTADIEMIMDSVFHPIREARSSEYVAGCEAALRRRLMGATPQCPFDSGTCQADAWYAGVREGHVHATDFVDCFDAPTRGPEILSAVLDEVRP